MSSKLVAFSDGIAFLTALADRGDGVEIVCLAFSEALDLVPHDILIKALAFYGINRHILHGLKNWLNDRPQNVVVNGRYQLTRSYPAELSRVELSPVPSNTFIRDADKEKKNLCWQSKQMTQRSGRY